MAVSRYVTLSKITHHGVDFPAGTPVALSDAFATPLLAAGAIAAQAGALPAMPTVPGNVVRETVDTAGGGKAKTYLEVIPGGDGGIALSEVSGIKPRSIDRSGLLLGDCPPSSQKTLAIAIKALVAKCSFIGDSNTENANAVDRAMGYLGGYRELVQRNLQAEFPNVAWTFHNWGLSGRTLGQIVSPTYVGQAGPAEDKTTGFYRAAATDPYWGTGAGSTAGLSLLAHVKATAPDVIFVLAGHNPQLDGDFVTALIALVAEVGTWPKVPTIELVSPYPPAVAYQDQRRAVALGRIMRGFAKKNGLGLIDAARIARIQRDGVDDQQGAWRQEWTAASDQSWDNWLSHSGSVTAPDRYTRVFGRNSFIQLPIDAHRGSVSCTAILTGTNATGTLMVKVRDESALVSDPATVPGPSWAQVSQFSGKLMSSAGGEFGASASYTVNPAGNKIRLDFFDGRFELYIDGVLKNSGWDFRNMRAGRVQIGGYDVANTGSSTGLIVTNPSVLYQEPRRFMSEYIDDDIVGAPFSNSDFSSRVPYGGNGANHPSSLGVMAMYTPGIRELIRGLQIAVAIAP